VHCTTHPYLYSIACTSWLYNVSRVPRLYWQSSLPSSLEYNSLIWFKFFESIGSLCCLIFIVCTIECTISYSIKRKTSVIYLVTLLRLNPLICLFLSSDCMDTSTITAGLLLSYWLVIGQGPWGCRAVCRTNKGKQLNIWCVVGRDTLFGDYVDTIRGRGAKKFSIKLTRNHIHFVYTSKLHFWSDWYRGTRTNGPFFWRAGGIF